MQINYNIKENVNRAFTKAQYSFSKTTPRHNPTLPHLTTPWIFQPPLHLPMSFPSSTTIPQSRSIITQPADDCPPNLNNSISLLPNFCALFTAHLHPTSKGLLGTAGLPEIHQQQCFTQQPIRFDVVASSPRSCRRSSPCGTSSL